jgi:hypothetical protein
VLDLIFGWFNLGFKVAQWWFLSVAAICATAVVVVFISTLFKKNK